MTADQPLAHAVPDAPQGAAHPNAAHPSAAHPNAAHPGAGQASAGQNSAGQYGPTPTTQAEALAQLQSIRRSIDNFDAALIHILAERFRCTQAVGQLKAAHDLPASDPEREARQVARLRSLAHEADLDPEFAEKFLTFVIAEVINHHERIASEQAS